LKQHFEELLVFTINGAVRIRTIDS
jgi:hypothetical protein